MNDSRRLLSHQFDANELYAQYPPVITDFNKSIVFKLGLNEHYTESSVIGYTRCAQMGLPEEVFKTDVKLVKHSGYFSYPPSSDNCVEWHLNFAHEDVFGFYGGPLFAQDEMQVAEHPILGCLREAILDMGIDRTTVQNGQATPILITGVERRCEVATDRNAELDRPYGLYGNEFQFASEEAIRTATTVLSPPAQTNIIAMESPQPDFGLYTRDQIKFILASAITGFSAAVKLSKEINEDAEVSIHTGYWGCGAYGGNRELMPLLQIIAAYCADIDALHFHTGGDHNGYDAALVTLDDIMPEWEEIGLGQLIENIMALSYDWGVSDGN